MDLQGGIYLFQLLDFYSCSGLALLWVTFFQTIAIGWFFGTQRWINIGKHFHPCLGSVTVWSR